MQSFSQPPARAFAPTVIPEDVPVYRVKEGKYFADDCLFEEGSIIALEGEPNLEMEPLNKKALEKMKTYLQKLDALGRAKAEKDGKAYVSLEDAFKNAYSLRTGEDGKKVALLNGPRQAPIMGGKSNKPKTVSKIADPGVNVNPVRMERSERDELNAADLV